MTDIFETHGHYICRSDFHYNPWGPKESDTTERLTHTHTHMGRTSEFSEIPKKASFLNPSNDTFLEVIRSVFIISLIQI